MVSILVGVGRIPILYFVNKLTLIYQMLEHKGFVGGFESLQDCSTALKLRKTQQ